MKLTSVLFLLLLSLTPVAQQKNAPPLPTGKMVDVGGWRLHLNCTGKNKGKTPTVIMEAGAGDFSFDWSLVQSEIAKFTRVCTYDRAGYAWSDAGPMPRTMKQIVYELHTALERVKVKSPYVLVGHSRGGLLVRVFANQYPKEVVGMVLVDASHEDHLIVITDRKTKKDEIVRERELSKGRQIPPVQTSFAKPADSGNEETQKRTEVGSPYNKLPPNVQQIRLWATSLPKRDEARISEGFDFFADEAAEIYSEGKKGGYSLGNMPLIVLTRGIPNEEEQANKQLQEDHDHLQADLAALSNNSKHIIAKKSGHHIQLDEPNLVIDAVKQVVKAAQRSSKLR